MSNIGIITAREYFTRVKKKSFILMTLLTPILITAFYGVIVWVNIGQSDSVEQQHIVVQDPSGVFSNALESPENITFSYNQSFSIDELLKTDSIKAIVSIPAGYSISTPLVLKYESTSTLSVNNSRRIENAFRDVVRNKKLTKLGIEQSAIDSLRAEVSLNQFKVQEDGSTKSSSLGINTAIGMLMAFAIYFFIFMYGVQVMKGVIEEKTNRIVELIVSTVKPFQLMMGKVLGIALVGLTQLTIWVVLSTILMSIVGLVVGLSMGDMQELSAAANNPKLANVDAEKIALVQSFFSLPLGKILGVFVFFFMGGYLFYGALFAAIGSAVDSETDTQQFMLPITMPLVFSIAVSFSLVAGDPHGTLATWMSMIPLTSPVVMMVRLPFLDDSQNWQIILSMVIMLLSILGAIALAGKIYRTGILMYGKKVTYKELAKWLFYKN